MRSRISIQWTGNNGKGTQSYDAYGRDHEISTEDKAHPILGSADRRFLGDSTRYNPEELFLASIANCHMLWYLHLCSSHGITVVKYNDTPEAQLQMQEDGGGEISDIYLNPTVHILEKDKLSVANELHVKVHKYCFIARSVTSEIHCSPLIHIFT